VVGHTWSLSIEEQFYIAWPLALLCLGTRRAKWLVVAYLAAAPILRAYVYFFQREHLVMVDLWSPTRSDSIAAGCLLALLAADPGFRKWSLPSPQTALRVGMAALGVLIVSVMLKRIWIYGTTVGYTVNAAAIVTLLWLCTNYAEGLIGRVLQSRPLVALGILSYSLYLWQQLFLNPHHTGWACRWPLNIILATLAAAASYLLVESPCLRIKDQLLTARRPKPATVEPCAPIVTDAIRASTGSS
jgi:peptidoglycan/LPS O-acetylase OafA/YrhL